jgi:ABC-2 type transport system ATP-binding protein
MRPSPPPAFAWTACNRRAATLSGQGGIAIESAVAVRLAHVTKRFDGHDAVADVDLEIPAGSIVGVIGPSGSGKTTTIRMVTGVLAPTSGTVEVLGDDARRLSRRVRERMGYLPQQFSMYPDLSVIENVDFAASIYGLVLWRRYRRRRAVLELLDLWSVRGRRAGQLSGGMRRRLELAAALVHEPSLLILDEPTAGIDPLLRRTVWDELHRLRDGGVTSLVTTQYVTEAEECDLVALISGGRLIAFATPDELRRSALGGEIIDVTTAQVFDAAPLAQAEGIIGVQQVGPRDVRFVVSDAGTASADIVHAIADAGGEAESVREVRLSFDEVFAALVERAEAAGGAPPGQPGSDLPARAEAA